MAKRANGQGSVWKHEKRGRWVYQAVIHGKPVRRTAPPGATEAEAEALLDTLLAAGAHGVILPSQHDTVSKYLDHWNTHADIAATTRQRRATIIRLMIEPVLGRTPLAALTARQVAGWLRWCEREQYALSTIQQARTVLKIALNTAIAAGLLPVNVAAQAKAKAAPARDWPEVTEAQYRRLIAAAQTTRDGALFVLALTLGLRQSELRGLRWSDVDVERGTLTVRHGVPDLPGRRALGPTKTTSSRRTLTLPQVALATLSARRREQLAAVRPPGWVDHDLIFPTKRGGHVSAAGSAITVPWRATLKAAQLDEVLADMRPHDCRHAFATHMLAAGVPIAVVSRALGHATIVTTLKVYAHLLTEQGDLAAAAIDRQFGGHDSSEMPSRMATARPAESG